MRNRIRYALIAIVIFTTTGCHKPEPVEPVSQTSQTPAPSPLRFTKWAKPDDTLTFFADSVLVQLWGIKATYIYHAYQDTLIVEHNKYTYKIDSGMLHLRNADNVLSKFVQLSPPGK